MVEFSRLMSLDVGKKRIGIALSDPLMITAQGYETYARQNIEKDIEHYSKIIKDYNVSKLIVGLPKTLSGEISFAAQSVLEYCKCLEENLSIDIIMYDERMSTAHAHRVMDECNVRHKNRRKNIDKIAATLILSDYMKGL